MQGLSQKYLMIPTCLMSLILNYSLSLSEQFHKNMNLDFRQNLRTSLTQAKADHVTLLTSAVSAFFSLRYTECKL